MRKFTSLLVLVFVCSVAANAQMAKFHALYLFNFAKNIGWPPEDANNNIVISVLGDNDVATELSTLAKTKKVGSRAVSVNSCANAAEVGECDIVFVSETKSGQIGAVLNAVSKYNTLVVSGKKGQCAVGAGIAFISDGGKLNFQISKVNINKAGLNVSNQLLGLGTVVD